MHIAFSISLFRYIIVILLPAICVRDLKFISGFNDAEVKQR